MFLINTITIFPEVFNNFLDTDKASIAIWGSIAMIVAIDSLNKKNKRKDLKFENYFS